MDMDSGVIIRPCRASELGDVLELWKQSRDTVGRTDDPVSLNALREHDRGAVLVAEFEGHIVGSLIAVWDGWRGNMYRLTVHPAHRRRGIAQRLVATGEERLQATGAKRISALVWSEDERAVRTWLSAGYVQDEGTGRFVKTVPK
jgi:ribosomal protein S18 acetylase RimI-like enzyme